MLGSDVSFNSTFIAFSKFNFLEVSFAVLKITVDTIGLWVSIFKSVVFVWRIFSAVSILSSFSLFLEPNCISGINNYLFIDFTNNISTFFLTSSLFRVNVGLVEIGLP